MQIVTNDGEIIAMYGYENVEALKQNKHFVDLIEQFKKHRDEKMDLWETLDIMENVLTEEYEKHVEENGLPALDLNVNE